MARFSKLKKSTKVAGFIWNHPANRGERFRVLSRALAWQLYKRATGRPWTLDVFDGMQLICYPDSTSASALIYANGYSDFAEMMFLKRYLRPGDRVADVGANVGVYTLLMASLVGPSGKVDAFEASPATYPRLHENVAFNSLSQIQTHETAVGAKVGTLSFTPGNTSTNHLVLNPTDDDKSLIQVPVVPLDNLFAPDDQLTFVKMDIEGAELLALQGAKRLLESATPPVWLIEVNSATRYFGHSEPDVEAFLNKHGYDLAIYDADSGHLNFVDQPWRFSQNVFAISRNHCDQVARRLTIATS